MTRAADALAALRERLAGVSDSAALDAELLVARVLRFSRAALAADPRRALAPEARNVSTLSSAGFSARSSTSSSSGRIATVAAEVWMRPCVSVSGTRCTRWPPLSYCSSR
jgi:hypothetical protein